MPDNMYSLLGSGSIPTPPSTVTKDQPRSYLPGVQARRVPLSPWQPPGFAPTAGPSHRAPCRSPITAIALPGPATGTAKWAAGSHAAARRGQDPPGRAWQGEGSGGIAVTPFACCRDRSSTAPDTSLPPKLCVIPAGLLVQQRSPLSLAGLSPCALSQQGLFQLDSHIPTCSQMAAQGEAGANSISCLDSLGEGSADGRAMLIQPSGWR